jgi:hypothetical protein
MDSSSHSKKIIVSSVYCRWVRPPSISSGINPLIIPASLAFVKMVAKALATRLNSKGDNGSPYLNPFISYGIVPMLTIQIDPNSPTTHHLMYPPYPFIWDFSSLKPPFGRTMIPCRRLSQNPISISYLFSSSFSIHAGSHAELQPPPKYFSLV